MKFKTCLLLLLLSAFLNVKANSLGITRLSDVIYDHRDGVALVMDVLVPEKQNGIAVFFMVSGGWMSMNAAYLSANDYKCFTDKGETVFLVSHGSKPRFKVPEIIDQIQHAIRYVRYNARKFGVDPDKFGITGASSGGHLSVSAGVFGKGQESEAIYRKDHNLKLKDYVDPVNLVSSKVQAVACFFPPTNLVSYNHPDSTFAEFKNVGVFVDAFNITKETSRAEAKEIFRLSSPYFYVGIETPPTMIFQGTKDLLVPYNQSISFINKLKEYNVPCELIIKDGAGHGWPHNKSDEEAMVNWFEKYLTGK